mmetsp:Transcript_32361/g.32978  ORF Transcript_32361/g.32978 Transcript_32361/m.32978 type:complete len:424 (+) Transcript_32361:243-1514(+)
MNQSFTCLLCLHITNIPCAYAYEPIRGACWDINNMIGGHKRKYKYNDSIEQTNQIYNNNIDNNNNNNINNSNNDKITTPKFNLQERCWNRLEPVDMFSTIKTASTASSSLILRNNPYTKQLNTVYNIVEAWEKKVEALFNLETTQSILSCVSDICTPIELLQETKLFNQLIRLYLELRVLHIYHPLLDSIRIELWSLSARTVIRSVVCTSEHNQNDYDFKPSLQLIQRIITGGNILKINIQTNKVLSTLQSVFLECQKDLVAASVCDTTNAFSIVSKLEKSARNISLEKCYPYIRAKCLCVMKDNIKSHIQYIEKKRITNKSFDKNEEEINEKYCWCLQPEDGCMICCDRCDLWYHVPCVIQQSSTKTSKTLLSKILKRDYMCIICCVANNISYAYEWPCEFIISDEVSESKGTKNTKRPREK